MLNNLRCSRGFSVTELLVGFGLFGALVVASFEGMHLYIATNKYVKIQEQVLDVRANLRNRLNCEYTLAPIITANQCDGSQYVNLKDGNNVDIVLANGSAKIGDYKIRSQCRNHGGFYEITSEYLRTNTDGTTAKDPMTHRSYAWQKLFAVPIVCSLGCTEADVVSFEPSLGFAPVRGMAITNQFEASHGVSFSIEGASASPVLAEINVADPRAFKEDGSGRINALVDAQSKAIMQKFFLTLPIRHAVLVVTYSKPVKAASGYMFDIDNTENWTITPYDANGRELPGAWSYAARDNEMIYNGKSMLWTIKERPTADISMIKFKGVKPANSNGASLAFDRFSPGKVCP